MVDRKSAEAWAEKLNIEYPDLHHWVDNQTEGDLANDIMGIRQPNEAMSRGTAYHMMLEHGPEGYKHSVKKIVQDRKANVEVGYLETYEIMEWEYRVNEPELGKVWIFSPEAVGPIYALRSQYAAMIHELKAQYTTEVSGYEVVMNLRFDGLYGTVVNEFKTKGRAPEFLEYFDALQWRCYLLAFKELTAVDYTVFELNTNNTKCTPHRFSFARHENHEAVVRGHLSGFIAWLELRPELLAHLEGKAEKSAGYIS